MKICLKCGSDFMPKYKNSRFCSYRCRKAYASMEFYRKYPERVLAQSRKWRAENPDRYRETNRAYAARTVEHRRIIMHRNYLRRGKDHANQQSRQWCALHKYEVLERQRKRRARKKGSPVIETITRHEWDALKREWKFKCVYCGKRKKLTQDHAEPLSRGGKHTLDNIVPACVSCNSRKMNRTWDEYMDLLISGAI